MNAPPPRQDFTPKEWRLIQNLKSGRGLFFIRSRSFRVYVANRGNRRTDVIRLLAEHVIRPRAMGLEGSSHRLTAVMPFFFHFVVFSHHEINISAGSGSSHPDFFFFFQFRPFRRVRRGFFGSTDIIGNGPKGCRNRWQAEDLMTGTRGDN